MDATGTGPDRDAVRLLRQAAAVEWNAVSGAVSACTLAKNGQSFPAAKFHEGRVHALGEVVRETRSDPTPDAVARAAASAADRWREDAASPSRADRDWQAYLAGGLQALGEITG